MGLARGQGVARKDYWKLEIVISNKKKKRNILINIIILHEILKKYFRNRLLKKHMMLNIYKLLLYFWIYFKNIKSILWV
jgi:hypothetical protein